MSFANPIGLWTLLAIPAIVAIHIFQRRFPPLKIASLHLWGLESDLKAAGRRVNRLPITSSLILELLAALLIAVLLSQPRFESLRTATHLVVILDNSGSMQSIPEGDESIRDLAVQFLEERVQGTSGRVVVTVVLSGKRPVTLAGPKVEWDKAKKIIEDWSPSEPSHPFESAWDLASQIAGTSGEMLFLTDRLPHRSVTVPKNLEIVSLGTPSDNLAIAHASWKTSDDSNEGTVFFKIRNFGDRSNRLTAKIEDSNGRTVFRREIDMEARGETSVSTRVPDGAGVLDISLEGEYDSLSLDSKVSLVEPKRRTVRIAVAFPVGHPAVEPINRAIHAVGGTVSGNVSTAHLVIGPASMEPDLSNTQWWLGFGPIDDDDEKKRSAKTPSTAFPFLIERNHPLVQDLKLDGVRWGGVQDVGRNVTPLVSCGGMPIFYRLNDVSFIGYEVNIDLNRSTFSQSEDWPIFFHNLIERRKTDLPGLTHWNFAIGQPIALSRPGIADRESREPLSLRIDGKTKELIDHSSVDLPFVMSPSVCEILEGETVIERFAVNFFDPTESSLLSLNKGHREIKSSLLASPFKLDRPFSWVILLLLCSLILAMFANWFVLRRRNVKNTPENRTPLYS